MEMTKEELISCIHEMDLKLRPIALFVNPDNETIVREGLKEINKEDACLVVINEAVPKNRIIIAERDKLEIATHAPTNLSRRGDFGCNNCKHQPGPLLMCDWMKTQPMVHLKCPRWEARTK